MANSSIRRQLIPYFSHIVTDHLCNDIRNDNITAAAAIARLQAFAESFDRPVWATTQFPHVTGAITLADGTDQVPTTNGGYGAKLAGLNALIRAGIVGIAGSFDLSLAVRLGADDTKWYANGTALLMSPDMLHPATYASQCVVNQGVLDTSLLVRYLQSIWIVVNILIHD